MLSALLERWRQRRKLDREGEKSARHTLAEQLGWLPVEEFSLVFPQSGSSEEEAQYFKLLDQHRWQQLDKRLKQLTQLRLQNRYVVPFTRELVDRADDYYEAEWTLLFQGDHQISDFLQWQQLKENLRLEPGWVWVFEVHKAEQQDQEDVVDKKEIAKPIAVLAHSWEQAALLVTDFPVSSIGHGMLYAKIHQGIDPEELITRLLPRAVEWHEIRRMKARDWPGWAWALVHDKSLWLID